MRRKALFILGLIISVMLLPAAVMAEELSPEDYLYPESGGLNITNPWSPMELNGAEKEAPRYDARDDARKGARTDARKGAGDLDYTYTITPLLPPFNQYFFVKTNDPDPESFKFADKDSVYSDDSQISLSWNSGKGTPQIFADINYEDPETGRVNGGYIFYSGDTDGGQIVLQKANKMSQWYTTWSDTGVILTLPSLENSVDYLVNTYADKDSFFDNMDAVQSGFSSICLYSGSFIRGKLVKENEYWRAAVAGHLDQSFYIYSPYARQDSRALFASAIYPYRYDSLGFPGMMGAVSRKLDSSSSYEWDDYAHDIINVTYNGETHSYGGQGNGQGQGISEDKIARYFTFGAGETEITLDGIRSLLKSYGAIEMSDDIPREDALTWGDIYDAAGDGAWVRLSGQLSDGSPVYEYFYQKGAGREFDSDEWGVGDSIYWWGDLGYAQDVWVDGRYVGEWRYFIPGATFADHPESSIMLNNVTIPQISYYRSYRKNQETGQTEIVYTDISIQEETKNNVLYKYKDGKWTVGFGAFNSGCADADLIATFVEQGLVDEKYLDMVTLTRSRVDSMGIDRNTNAVPDKGYLFDGRAKPGTVFDEATDHCWWPGDTKAPDCVNAGEKTYKCLVCGETKREVIPALGHKLKKTEAKDPTCEAFGNYEYWTCSECGKHFSDAAGSKEVGQQEWQLPPTGHKWNDGEVIEEPTYAKAGLKQFRCTACGKTKTETIPQLVPEDGQIISVDGGAEVRMIDVWGELVAYTKAPDELSVTVPDTVTIGDTEYQVVEIEPGAFDGTITTTVIIGKHVRKIRAKAFQNTGVTKLILKTKLLWKGSVKGSLKGSIVKTIKVKVGRKATNKKYVKTYLKFFTKKNAGRKVIVK